MGSRATTSPKGFIVLVAISALAILGLTAIWLRSRRFPRRPIAGTDPRWNTLAEAYGMRRIQIHALLTCQGILPSRSAARVYSAYEVAETQTDKATHAEPASLRAAIAAEDELWRTLEDVRAGAVGLVWRGVDAAHIGVSKARQEWGTP